VAVVNISKILCPSAPCNSTLSKEADTRGKSLRNYLAVDDTSPLRSRKFRNYFEHYDFRIEQWAAKSKDRMIIQSNIAPIDYFAGITPTPKSNIIKAQL
jgi:hypothetical protein